jgi:hypothetical protein
MSNDYTDVPERRANVLGLEPLRTASDLADIPALSVIIDWRGIPWVKRRHGESGGVWDTVVDDWITGDQLVELAAGRSFTVAYAAPPSTP